jgi:hypothetical protein
MMARMLSTAVKKMNVQNHCAEIERAVKGSRSSGASQTDNDKGD